MVCRVWKPLDAFYRDGSHGSTQGGRHCRCKECYKKGREAQKSHYDIAEGMQS